MLAALPLLFPLDFPFWEFPEPFGEPPKDPFELNLCHLFGCESFNEAFNATGVVKYASLRSASLMTEGHLQGCVLQSHVSSPLCEISARTPG